MAFSEASDCGVAAHLAHCVQVLGEDGNLSPKARGRESSLHPCVASADDKDVVFFWVNEHVWAQRAAEGS